MLPLACLRAILAIFASAANLELKISLAAGPAATAEVIWVDRLAADLLIGRCANSAGYDHAVRQGGFYDLETTDLLSLDAGPTKHVKQPRLSRRYVSVRVWFSAPVVSKCGVKLSTSKRLHGD